jgi:hypothetical protein
VNYLTASLAADIGPHPRSVSGFVECACRKAQDGLSGVFLAGLEGEAVEFQEENADHETNTLIAIHERVIADDAGCVKSSHGNDVSTVGIGMVLAGSGQSGLQKASVAQSRCTAMDGQKAIVDR